MSSALVVLDRASASRTRAFQGGKLSPATKPRRCRPGLRTTRPAKEIQAELLECGILTGTSSDPQVLRLLPPFILEEQQVDMLRDALRDLPT